MSLKQFVETFKDQPIVVILSGQQRNEESFYGEVSLCGNDCVVLKNSYFSYNFDLQWSAVDAQGNYRVIPSDTIIPFSSIKFICQPAWLWEVYKPIKETKK